jgi:hypothetical protein
MPTDVLPELATGSVDLFRNVLDRSEDGDWTPADLDGLAAHSRHIVRLMKDIRSGAESLLDRGTEAQRFKARYEHVASSLDGHLKVLSAVLAFVQRQPVTTEQTDLLEALRSDEREARDIRRTFAEWLEVLNRPMKPIDWKKLEEDVEADRKAGRLVNVETFEDLFGEPPAGA